MYVTDAMAENGHVEAANVLDTLQEQYDQAEELADKLPENYRVVEAYPEYEQVVERESEHEPFWVPVAEFKNGEMYEWAEEVAEGTGEEYRCVIDRTNRSLMMEKRVEGN